MSLFLALSLKLAFDMLMIMLVEKQSSWRIFHLDATNRKLFHRHTQSKWEKEREGQRRRGRERERKRQRAWRRLILWAVVWMGVFCVVHYTATRCSIVVVVVTWSATSDFHVWMYSSLCVCVCGCLSVCLWATLRLWNVLCSFVLSPSSYNDMIMAGETYSMWCQKL